MITTIFFLSPTPPSLRFPRGNCRTAVAASVFDPQIKTKAESELTKLREAYALEVRLLVLLPLDQIFYILGMRQVFLWIAGFGIGVMMLADASFSFKVTQVKNTPFFLQSI